MDHLELPEVCHTDGVVFRTHVENVWDIVVIEVIFAGISSSIACSKEKKKKGDVKLNKFDPI